MTALAKTVVATGVSSGLGLEAIKQLLAAQQPYRIILGARDAPKIQQVYGSLGHGSQQDAVEVLPLELNNLGNVKRFAQQTLERLGQGKIDYLLLNAAMSIGSEKPGPHKKWSEAYVVNHLSQHYLVHLLRDKLVESKSRLVFVSSGAVRNVPDPSVLDQDVKEAAGVDAMKLYAETKFINLLAAHWWRRQLTDQCVVVAVSPGFIHTTNLGRHTGMKFPTDHPDAKTPAEGGENVLRALSRDDLPEDPEQIFLTSWGEWWPKDVYEKTLDKELQDKWCPSKEEIEAEEGLEIES